MGKPDKCNKQYYIDQIVRMEVRKQYLHHRTYEEIKYVKIIDPSLFEEILVWIKFREKQLKKYVHGELSTIYSEIAGSFTYKDPLELLLQQGVNYDNLCRLDSWTIKEFVALTLGVESALLEKLWMQIERSQNSYFIQAYKYYLDLALRAERKLLIYDGMSPIKFIEWASKKGIEMPKLLINKFPQYYNTKLPAHLDESHPNFSPKLYAAIACHEFLCSTSGNFKTSVKKTAINYLKEHAQRYNLIFKGKVNQQAIKDIAKTVNWQDKGGAPKSSTVQNSKLTSK